MQVTIDIPDQLARELESERGRLSEIIARGLRRSWSAGSALRREVVAFLARQPSAEEVIGFRPSGETAARAQELLDRNRQSALSPDEQAELDEMCEVERFMSLLKAEVLARRRSTA